MSNFPLSKTFNNPVFQGVVKPSDSFGSSTITLSDGTRQVVNPSGINLNLFSGQGRLFNGVDNGIATGFYLRLDKSFTVLWAQEVSAGNNFQGANGVSGSGGSRFYFGLNDNKIASGIYASATDKANSGRIGHGGVLGDVLDCAIKFDLVNLVATYFINQAVVGTLDIYDNLIDDTIALDEFFVGKFTAIWTVTGFMSGVYIIPELLSDQSVISHQQAPERTLYYDGGVLKSDKLNQSTIDDVKAGNGLFMPLSEEYGTFRYVRNHGLPLPINKIPTGDFSDGALGFESLWSVAGGEATINSPIDNAVNDNISIASVMELGKTYMMSIYVSAVAFGELDMWAGTGQYHNIGGAVGWKDQIFTCLNVNAILFPRTTTGFSGSISEIRLYEVESSGFKEIIGWVDGTTITSGKKPYGSQSLLLERDNIGLQTGSKSGELYFTNSTNVELEAPIVTDGDWEVELFADMSKVLDDSKGSGSILELELSNAGLVTETVSIIADVNNGIVLTSTSIGSEVLSSTKAVITLVSFSDKLAAYVAGVRVFSADLIASDSMEIKNIGKSTDGTRADAVVGSLSFYDATRSSSQRLQDAAKLAVKHGV